MKRFLFALALVCALGTSALAQSTLVAGTRVLDNTGALLASGKWCFGSTCFTVTSGVFSGSVTSGTQNIAVTNSAGSTTYLTVPNVSIAGSYFSWDTYVVPSNGYVYGIGVPRIACTPGAQYGQTDGNQNKWQCQNINGVATWNGLGGNSGGAATPFQLGSVATLDPGTPAYATNIGTSTAPIIDLGIPQGYPGCVVGSTCTNVMPQTGGGFTGPVTGPQFNAVVWPAPGTSLYTAVSALSSSGGDIELQCGTYLSGLDTGSLITKSNVRIHGCGIPALNSATSPTALVGGTIIQGEVDVAGYDPAGSATGFQMSNLGIDVGANVVAALYSGTPHNGLEMSNVGQVTGVAPTTGVKIDNVVVLGDTTSSANHAMLFENLTGASFDHLYSYLDGIGQVFKVTDSTIRDIHCSGHGTACVYIKGDTYAPSSNNVVDGVYATSLNTPGDTGGLNIDAGSVSIGQEQLSNLSFTNTTSGVEFLMDAANGLAISNVNINNVFMDDSGISSGSRTAPCLFFYSTGTSNAHAVNISNVVCNNVKWAIWMTTNDQWDHIFFNDVQGSNFTSTDAAILSGTVTVSNAYFYLGGGYAFTAEGTTSTTVRLVNVSTDLASTLTQTIGTTPVIKLINGGFTGSCASTTTLTVVNGSITACS